MIIKYSLILLLITNLLSATTKEDIVKMYTQKNYRYACRKSTDLFQKYKADEEFLTIYADSCLKVDMINKTILPIIKLYKTPRSRENAAYFATILYQKKLLYHALVDDVDISYVNLPKTKYILSIIFSKFVSGDYNYKNDEYWFSNEANSEIRYKLSVEENQKIKKMFLRTYLNGNLIKTRTYW